MSCLLCFEYNGDFVELASEEAIEHQIGSILLKHFYFVFQEEPHSGKVCRKCWCKVGLFHEFYICIEEIHRTVFPSTVVIEDLIQTFKDGDELKNESNDFDGFSEFMGGDCDFTIATNNYSYEDEPIVAKVVPEQKHDDDAKVNSKIFDAQAEPPTPSEKTTANEPNEWDSESDGMDDAEDEKIFSGNSSQHHIFHCSYCKRTYTRRTQYHQHLRSKHSKHIFECDTCNQVLLTERALKRHVMKLHLSDKEKRAMENEKKKISTFKTIQCSTCSEFFLTEKQLRKHQKLTHLLLPFKCNHIKCVESFASTELLEVHKTEVHAKSPCPLCGKQVMTVFMEQHYERMHNKDKQGICDQCGRVFPNSYMLKTHIKSEHDDPERFHCDICKGVFKSKYNLQKHIKIIHIDKAIACPICRKVSPNIKALRSHLYVHKQPDKECIVCGRRFKHTSKLREHSYTHSGVTDAYECNWCGKKFRFGSSWSAHKMKYHPAEMAEARERLERIKRNAKRKAGEGHVQIWNQA